MIKRPVLAEDDHEMLDRRRGPRLVTVMAVIVVPTEVWAVAIGIVSGNRTAPDKSSRDANHRSSGKQILSHLVPRILSHLTPSKKVGRDDL
jgi:hypothetical protein